MPINFTRALLTVMLLSLGVLAAARPVYPGDAGIRDIPGGVISEDTVWSGDCLVSGRVVVSSGALLTVEEGSNLLFRGSEAGILVQGGIAVEGKKGKPVVISGEPGEKGRWGGIIVSGADREVRFLYSSLSGAKTALALVHATALIEECVFEKNVVGVDLSMESTADIVGSIFRENGTGLSVRLQSKVEAQDSRFEENEESGVFFFSGGGRITGCAFRREKAVTIRQGRDVFLGGNSFTGCEVGIYAEQVRHDVRITGNSFEGGETGIQCSNFASPWIACNEFRGLAAGVVAARFSRPLVERCLFEGNRRGLNANNKSGFPVRQNIFRKNEEAVFVDMSSYPSISENNIIDNAKGIVLGDYMSADWEKRVGSASISGAEARRHGSRSLESVTEKKEFKGEVDARNNWWGDKTTAEMDELGAEGNITVIDDYFDRNEVTYPDFGEGSYRLDRVVYRPWRKKEVEGAGPAPGGCGSVFPADPSPPDESDDDK